MKKNTNNTKPHRDALLKVVDYYHEEWKEYITKHWPLNNREYNALERWMKKTANDAAYEVYAAEHAPAHVPTGEIVPMFGGTAIGSAEMNEDLDAKIPIYELEVSICLETLFGLCARARSMKKSA